MNKDAAQLIAQSLAPMLSWVDVGEDIPIEKLYYDIYSHFSFMSTRVSKNEIPLFPTYVKLPTHLRIKLYRLPRTREVYTSAPLSSSQQAQPQFGVAHVFNTSNPDKSDKNFEGVITSQHLTLRRERPVYLILRAQHPNPIVLEAVFPVIASPLSDQLKKEMPAGIYMLNKGKRPLIVRYPLIAKDEATLTSRFKMFHESSNKLTSTMPLFYV